MTFILALIAIIGLAVAPAALAQGCCGPAPSGLKAGCGMATDAAGCSHKDHAAAQAAASQAPAQPLLVSKPVQVVLNNYFQLQNALVKDSLEGVASAAEEIAKSVRADSAKVLSATIAEQADAVAKAKDLEAARSAFKALSESLVNYANEQKIKGLYVAYCPMAKASWLQTEKVVLNPYMGMAMPHCGQIKS
jgi:hypothetical protein